MPETDPKANLAIVLSPAERKLIADMPVFDDEAVQAAQTSQRTVRLSVVQLDGLADALSVKANQTAECDQWMKGVSRLPKRCPRCEATAAREWAEAGGWWEARRGPETDQNRLPGGAWKCSPGLPIPQLDEPVLRAWAIRPRQYSPQTQIFCVPKRGTSDYF